MPRFSPSRDFGRGFFMPAPNSPDTTATARIFTSLPVSASIFGGRSLHRLPCAVMLTPGAGFDPVCFGLQVPLMTVKRPSA